MALKEECDCTSYYLPPSGVKECTLFDEGDCVEGVIKKYHAGAYMDKPYCQCQDACVSENYIATLSTAEYPSKRYGEAITKENKRRADAANNNSSSSDAPPRDINYYRYCYLVKGVGGGWCFHGEIRCNH
eukprot:sb/3475221/